MANEIWQQEEQKFLQAIKDVKIPNSSLENVAVVIPKKASDLDVIPQSGGCYWIWTNEPVKHSLHKNARQRLLMTGKLFIMESLKTMLEAELSIIYLVRPMPDGQE